MSRPVPKGHEGLVLGGGLRLALSVLGPKQFVTSFCKKPAAAKAAPQASTAKPASRRIKRSRAA